MTSSRITRRKSFILLCILLLLGTFGCDSDRNGKPPTRAAENASVLPAPDLTCKGRPKPQRARALGLELGSCLIEVMEKIKKTGLELKRDRAPGMDENLLPYVVVGYGGEFGFEMPEEVFSILMFDNEQVLFAIRANYSYKMDHENAKAAFATLDSMLAKKFGKAELKPFIKRWKSDTVSVELKFDVDMKSNSSIVLTYFYNDIYDRVIGRST